ncbi:MAG: nuclear transport factor 2 family protein [Trebonia sp.]
MSDEDESVVRAAYEVYGQGEVNRLLELVHPDLEWTYLDPSMENPQPQTCHGREQLAWALGQQADRGLVSQVEEIASSGDKVMVAVHTAGADQRRAWQAEDRSYLVLTMGRGRIVALRDFRDRDEARGFAGLGQGKR